MTGLGASESGAIVPGTAPGRIRRKERCHFVRARVFLDMINLDVIFKVKRLLSSATTIP
jgi:hypothetical protein